MDLRVLLVGNLSDGFRIFGPFDNFDDADEYAKEFDSENWIAQLELPQKWPGGYSTNVLWNNNYIQFARLIAELEAYGVFEQGDWVGLLESMDISDDEFTSIISRAQQDWDDIKERHIASTS